MSSFTDIFPTLTRLYPPLTVHSVLLGYGSALLAVTGATLFRLLLDPILANKLPYITFFLAIAVSGWIGGAGPAIVAVVLAALVGKFLLLPPVYSLSVDSTADAVGLIVFMAVGMLIAFTCEAMKQAQRRAEEHGEMLRQQMVDIERHKEALRESDERFRIMADSSPVIIWVTRQDGGVEFINSTYCHFFGTTLAQAQADGWKMLVHPDDADRYANAFLTAVRDRTPFRAQVRVRRADGQWRWLDSYATPRFSTFGVFLGHVGSSPDITEMKLAEQSLQESEGRLQTTVADLEASGSRLEEKINELETFHDLVVGRELKMMALERENAKLQAEIERLRAPSST